MKVNSPAPQTRDLRSEETTGASCCGVIAVAEDDDEMRSLIALSLKQDGYRVVECRNGVELLSRLHRDAEQERRVIALVISDIRMPGTSGLAILDGLSRQSDAPAVVLITALGDSETHAEARRLGAVACLDKPFDMAELMRHVRNILPSAVPEP